MFSLIILNMIFVDNLRLVLKLIGIDGTSLQIPRFGLHSIDDKHKGSRLFQFRRFPLLCISPHAFFHSLVAISFLTAKNTGKKLLPAKKL